MATRLGSDRLNDEGARGITRGEGGAIPRAPSPMGGAKSLRAPPSPNNVTSTFFNAVHLLPKDLNCEHGGAKLASCPGRHLTSLRPGGRA